MSKLLTFIELLRPILEHIQNRLIAFAVLTSKSAYASVVAALHRHISLACDIHNTTDIINNLVIVC